MRAIIENGVGMSDLQDDDSWIARLFAWADAHNLPPYEWLDDETDENEGGFWVGFPRDRATLLSFTCLNLSWHDLTELPEELANLTQLTELSMAKTCCGMQPDWEPKTDNKIQAIPAWISRLHNLRVLDFSRNAINEIPSNIGQLQQLEVLWMCSNNISYIPESIFELKRLKRLCFSFNQIEVIPPGLSKLTQLQYLGFQSNRLLCVPQEIVELECLSIVDLNKNSFSSFPVQVFKLKALEQFDMVEIMFNLLGRDVVH